MIIGRIVVLALLMAGTIGFFNGYERYEPVGPELLANPDFREGFAHWALSGRGVAEAGGDGSVVLRSAERSADVAVRQSLLNPGLYSLLRLSGKLRAQDIRPGKRFWHKGRLVLVSLGKDQRMLDAPHVVVSLEGTMPWQAYQNVFRIPRDAQEVRVGIQLIGATGIFAAKELSLREVRERSHYQLYRGLGITVWVLGLAWLSLPYVTQLRFNVPSFLVYVAVAGIFVGALMPVTAKMEFISEIDATLEHIAQHEGSDGDSAAHSVYADLIPIDKLGHLLFFVLLAFAMLWAYPGVNRLHLLLVLLVLAAISEVLQFYVEGRQPQLRDFLIDSIGLSIGIGLSGLLYVVRRWLKGCRLDHS